MGLVKFFGKQFVIALVMGGALLLVMTGWAGPLLSVAGSLAAGGPLGFGVVTLLGFAPILLSLWFGLLHPEGRPGGPAGTETASSKAWDLVGMLTAAGLFILAASRSLSDPSAWHASAMGVLSSGENIDEGLPELAAVAVLLGPLLATTLVLQFTSAVTRDDAQEGRRGRTWVWVVAGALVVAGVVGAFMLAG